MFALIRCKHICFYNHTRFLTIVNVISHQFIRLCIREVITPIKKEQKLTINHQQ